MEYYNPIDEVIKKELQSHINSKINEIEKVKSLGKKYYLFKKLLTYFNCDYNIAIDLENKIMKKVSLIYSKINRLPKEEKEKELSIIKRNIEISIILNEQIYNSPDNLIPEEETELTPFKNDDDLLVININLFMTYISQFKDEKLIKYTKILINDYKKNGDSEEITELLKVLCKRENNNEQQ